MLKEMAKVSYVEYVCVFLKFGWYERRRRTVCDFGQKSLDSANLDRFQ